MTKKQKEENEKRDQQLVYLHDAYPFLNNEKNDNTDIDYDDECQSDISDWRRTKE
jgi:hypothetical protein